MRKLPPLTSTPLMLAVTSPTVTLRLEEMK